MLLSEKLGANAATVHPSSRVAKALAEAGVAKTSELIRVVNLPRRKFDVDAYPDSSIMFAKGPCGEVKCRYCKNGGPFVRPLQTAMICEAAQCNGGFFNVGVGHGKTLASFLMHAALGAVRTVLLVPSQLKTKTLETDLPILDRHYVLPDVYEAKDFKGQSGVFILSYDEISNKKATDLLDKIRPDLIVADEAHRLKNVKSSRGKRFMRFMRQNACKFVAMTGSPMSKVITEFAHLIELALGKGSPLPKDFPSLVQWSDCIDNQNTGIGALSMLCDDGETARQGFQRRLVETPGVICTTTGSAGMPIEVRLLTAPPPPPVKKALTELVDLWTWDGEEYSQTLEIARLERQLTQGFFYRLINPDRDWIQRKNAWNRAIRARLNHTNKAGQDSPALLQALAERGIWLPMEWIDWCEVKYQPAPQREVVAVSQWLVDLAKQWIAASPEPSIIWVDSPVVGRWLAGAGIAFFGEGQDSAVNELAERALAGNITVPTIALSIRAHSTGKNLQAWARNLVLFPPAGVGMWEQMIGRTHRDGQLADEVTFDVVLGSEAAERAMQSALDYARAVEDTTGQPQKLNLCHVTREPWSTIFR